MTAILAIDTSSEACSATLKIDNHSETLFEIAPQAHSQLLLPQCEQLLANAGMELSQVDVIAYSRGPGSFTGLRIGAGVVQGLAFAHDIPVIPVSSLEALAQRVAKQHRDATVLSVIDARMQEVYWAAYRIDDQGCLTLQNEETLSKPEAVTINCTGTVIGIGTGWDIYESALRNQIKPLEIDHIYSKQHVSAEEIALLAANKLARKEDLLVAAEKALPVYLRNNVVQKPNK